MVDVAAKPDTDRDRHGARPGGDGAGDLGTASASGGSNKGDVLGVARLAGIMAAKRTAT